MTYVVAAYAAAGEFDDASSLIDAAGNRGWGRNAGGCRLGVDVCVGVDGCKE